MDTFELTGCDLKLETYEWEDVWYEQTAEKEKIRVFYIGDSISRQIRLAANAANKTGDSQILFDNYSTSKAVDNPFFIEGIKYHSKQQGKRDIILFNNGLHGGHMDALIYLEWMEKTIEFMKEEFKNTPIAIVLTTYITKDGIEIVKERNKVALEISEKYNLPVIDLYTTSYENREFLRDGVHYTDEGAANLAKKLIDDINKILGK